MKKNQDFKGYESIRKGIHGAVGILVLGLLFSAGQVVAADEVATEVTSDTGLTISENSITDVPGRVMVGDEVMSDTIQTIYSTVDEVIREILIGLDNKLYTLGSIDVKNEFTSIFTDVQIYNGPSYDIII